LDLIPRPDLAVSDLLKERLIVRSDFDRTRFSATHGPSSLLKEDLTSSIAAALEFRALLMARDTRATGGSFTAFYIFYCPKLKDQFTHVYSLHCFAMDLPNTAACSMVCVDTGAGSRRFSGHVD